MSINFAAIDAHIYHHVPLLTSINLFKHPSTTADTTLTFFFAIINPQQIKSNNNRSSQSSSLTTIHQLYSRRGI